MNENRGEQDGGRNCYSLRDGWVPPIQIGVVIMSFMAQSDSMLVQVHREYGSLTYGLGTYRKQRVWGERREKHLAFTPTQGSLVPFYSTLLGPSYPCGSSAPLLSCPGVPDEHQGDQGSAREQDDCGSSAGGTL
mgnify:CR=1 FL=1